jgi:hypothetical protein
MEQLRREQAEVRNDERPPGVADVHGRDARW